MGFNFWNQWPKTFNFFMIFQFFETYLYMCLLWTVTAVHKTNIYWQLFWCCWTSVMQHNQYDFVFCVVSFINRCNNWWSRPSTDMQTLFQHPFMNNCGSGTEACTCHSLPWWLRFIKQDQALEIWMYTYFCIYWYTVFMTLSSFMHLVPPMLQKWTPLCLAGRRK